MGFEKGVPRHDKAGRTAGTPNKRTVDLLKTLSDLGYDPVAKMVEYGLAAEQEFKLARAREQASLEARERGENVKIYHDYDTTEYLKIAQTSAKEVMAYAYPKRKAMELVDEDGNNAFTTFTEMVKAVADAKS